MRKIWVLCMLWLCTPAFAVPIDAPLPNAAQEVKAREIFHSLRCMVCSGETINDSHAEVARDMRVIIRNMVAEGKDARAIEDYFISRYGEVVLMKPRFDMAGVFLWLTPLMILGLGIILVWRKLFAKDAS
jgi:cytochrome c-type biogenesis protein CcmH